MVSRLASAGLAISLALLFAASAVVCPQTNGEPCCCAPPAAESGLSSPAGCCQSACRQSPVRSAPGPIESSAASPSPELSVPPARGCSLDASSAASVPVALKTIAAAVASQDPPEVFLQKASFLI